MLRPDAFAKLTRELYASALGDLPWNKALESLTSAFGGRTCLMSVVDHEFQTLEFQIHGYDVQTAAEHFRSERFLCDPRRPYVANVQDGTVYYDHLLYDVKVLECNELYNENVKLHDAKYTLGAKLRLPHRASGLIVLLTTERQGHASEAAIESFGRLLPHFEQAFALGFLAEREVLTKAALLGALAYKADGVILVGAQSDIVFMNESAASMLRARDGLAHVAGQFVTSRTPETRRLLRLIQQARDVSFGVGENPGGRLLISRPSGKHPYEVLVAPTPQTERFLTARRVCCVMHVVDLAAQAPLSKEVACATFGLSDRESDLAVELARSPDLKSAAARAGMALNTARNHIHSIFAKCRVHSQMELSRMLAKLV